MRLGLVPVLARLLLAVAMLAAWQAALQHPIEHVDELGELVHLHDGHSPDDSEAGALCDLLDSLTACAPDWVPEAVAARQFATARSSFAYGAARAADAPPFLSQGPPASV